MHLRLRTQEANALLHCSGAAGRRDVLPNRVPSLHSPSSRCGTSSRSPATGTVENHFIHFYSRGPTRCLNVVLLERLRLPALSGREMVKIYTAKIIRLGTTPVASDEISSKTVTQSLFSASSIRQMSFWIERASSRRKTATESRTTCPHGSETNAGSCYLRSTFHCRGVRSCSYELTYLDQPNI